MTRCGKTWSTAHPSGDGTLSHSCELAQGHGGQHYCECGKVK